MIAYTIILTARTGGSGDVHAERDQEKESEIVRRWHEEYGEGQPGAVKYMQESFAIKEDISVELWMFGHPVWPGGLMVERLA